MGVTYIVNGRRVDPWGNVVEDGPVKAQAGRQGQATADPVVEAVGADRAKLLAESGFDTPDKIVAASNDELDAIDGIAAKTIEALRAVFGEHQPAATNDQGGNQGGDGQSGDS